MGRVLKIAGLITRLTAFLMPAADLAGLDAAAQAIGGDLALFSRMVWSAEAASWIADYNTRRSHAAIGHQPPFQRLNNLLGNDI